MITKVVNADQFMLYREILPVCWRCKEISSVSRIKKYCVLFEVHTYIHIYIHTYIHTNIHTHICTHIHTHIHKPVTWYQRVKPLPDFYGIKFLSFSRIIVGQTQMTDRGHLCEEIK